MSGFCHGSLILLSEFVSLTGGCKVGETSRHVRTVTGLAPLSGSLATGHHRTSAGHQLHPGSGVTATPVPERGRERERLYAICRGVEQTPRLEL